MKSHEVWLRVTNCDFSVQTIVLHEHTVNSVIIGFSFSDTVNA